MNVLLTGGHSGMGLELTKKLLSEGNTIGLVVRNEKRAEDTRKELPEGAKVSFFFADLSKRGDIIHVAKQISEQWDSIDALFNNAGVLLDQLYYAESGNEMHLEVNGIAPYLLTEQLLPLLKKGNNPTVVSTATAAMNKKNEINVALVKKPVKFKKLVGSYMDSKLALVLLMNSLSKENSAIRFVSINPGAIKTKMTAGDGMPGWLKPLRNLLFKSPEVGGKNLYDAGFGDRYKGTGIYINGGKILPMKLEITEEQKKELLTPQA